MPTDLPAATEAPVAAPLPFGIDGSRTSTNEKGIVLPHLCGTRKVALKWISPTCNYWTKNIKQKVGKEKKTVAKDVFCSIAGAVCLGPIERVDAIYYGGDAIWTTGCTFGANEHSRTITTEKGTFIVYRGTTSQPVDAVLSGQAAAWPSYEKTTFSGWYSALLAKIREKLTSAGTVDAICRDEHPRYAGVCYVVCKDLYCGRNSQAVPNIEIAVSRAPVVPAWLDVDATRAANGCNPVAIIAELLTRPELGVALTQDEIDADGLESLAASLAKDKARYYLSPLFDAQESASKLIEGILAHFDGFQASREGRFSLGYFPKDGVEPQVRTLSIHEMTEQPTMTLPDWSKTANRVVVKFPSRANDFEEDSVDRKSSYNLRVQGRIVTKSLEADAIIDADQALRYAGEQVELAAAPEDSGRITALAHKALNLDGTPMQPGERFRLNYEPWELDMICRITGVSQKSLGAVEINFVRERGLYAVPYSTPADPVTTAEPAAAAGIVNARVFELTDALSGGTGAWVGFLAAQPAPNVGGFVAWYSASPTCGESRTFDQIGSSEFWAANGSVATAVSTDAGQVRIAFPGDMGDFDVESAQGQANDALLLLVGDELLSVGQWEAVPDEPGVYRLEVLRGRRGTAKATHSEGEGAWLFYREQLLKVTHGSFSSDLAPQWKLQSVSVGKVQPLADALLIDGFRLRDRTSDAATAWITASDFSFLTTYDASGAATTSPESVEMLCHVEAMPNAAYQWQRYVSGAWVNVAGATASTLTVYAGGEGRYRCVVTAGTLRVETDPADITRTTEAPGGETPFACGGIVINGQQVVGARLPAVALDVDVAVPGVDGTDGNAASRAATETALTGLRDAIQSILDRLGPEGHGLIE